MGGEIMGVEDYSRDRVREMGKREGRQSKQRTDKNVTKTVIILYAKNNFSEVWNLWYNLTESLHH